MSSFPDLSVMMKLNATTPSQITFRPVIHGPDEAEIGQFSPLPYDFVFPKAFESLTMSCAHIIGDCHLAYRN